MSEPFKKEFYQLLVTRQLRYIKRRSKTNNYAYVFYIGYDKLSDAKLLKSKFKIEVEGSSHWYEACIDYCLSNRTGIKNINKWMNYIFEMYTSFCVCFISIAIVFLFVFGGEYKLIINWDSWYLLFK